MPHVDNKLITAILSELEEPPVTFRGRTAADPVLSRLANSLKLFLRNANRSRLRLRKPTRTPCRRPVPRCPASQPVPQPGSCSNRQRVERRQLRSSSRLYRNSPATDSGSSTKGEHPAHRNPQSTVRSSSLRSAPCQTLPTGLLPRKRDDRKGHNTAPVCLARHRCNVLNAKLRNKTHYQAPAA